MQDLKTAGLELGDWLAAAVAGIIFGIGSALAYFNRSKNVIHDRIDDLEEDLDLMRERNTAHGLELERVKASQENIGENLAKLEWHMEDNGRKMDELKDYLYRRGGNYPPHGGTPT